MIFISSLTFIRIKYYRSAIDANTNSIVTGASLSLMGTDGTTATTLQITLVDMILGKN